jgi:hypothetical protein
MQADDLRRGFGGLGADRERHSYSPWGFLRRGREYPSSVIVPRYRDHCLA